MSLFLQMVETLYTGAMSDCNTYMLQIMKLVKLHHIMAKSRLITNVGNIVFHHFLYYDLTVS